MLLFLEVAMKHYQNPFRTLSKPEWCLWIGSLLAVAAGFLSIGERDLLTLAASLIGVTASFLWQRETRWDRCSPSYSRFFIP